MKTLPKRCYTTSNNKLTLIINGHMGHYPVELEDNGDKPSSVEELNRMLGVTNEQLDIMIEASMFGWNIPLVTNYLNS